MSDFYQTPPRLTNSFETDVWLKPYLQWRLPKDYQKSCLEELKELGRRSATDLFELSLRADKNKPVHVPYDAWGRRVDEVRVSKEWDDLKDFSATEGMVATGYERRQGEWSRLFQFAKLGVFHPSSAFFTCPLAMADGAARVLEVFGDSAPLKNAFAHLTSRDPKKNWTSGQWMTERTGGSDVSHTSTIAKKDGDIYRLHGVKWFSSSTTSEMALALARIEGAAEGSRGLTLFFVETHKPDGGLNDIMVNRLKDKLGTWALPTAELTLQGTPGLPVGEIHHGVRTVATMLNITRLYNSICCVGQMSRGLELIKGYATQRSVFGRKLSEQPLFHQTYLDEGVYHLASLLLTTRMVEFLGKDETGKAEEWEKDLLRLFTPICKLFTAKAAIRVSSEILEGFGGAGYIEDVGVPPLLRDAQVFPIWEGATNVLCLDVLRVLQKSSSLNSFIQWAEELLARMQKGSSLKTELAAFENQWSEFKTQFGKFQAMDPIAATASLRSLAFCLAHLFTGLLMFEWETSGSAPAALRTAIRRWVGPLRSSWRLADPEDLQDHANEFMPKS